jgi:hypothetical protein
VDNFLIGVLILLVIAAACGSTAENRKTFKLGNTETSVTTYEKEPEGFWSNFWMLFFITLFFFPAGIIMALSNIFSADKRGLAKVEHTQHYRSESPPAPPPSPAADLPRDAYVRPRPTRAKAYALRFNGGGRVWCNDLLYTLNYAECRVVGNIATDDLTTLVKVQYTASGLPGTVRPKTINCYWGDL